MSSEFEAAISQLTQPVGGQYPRPWMTSLRDPLDARVFIVGMNQAKGYPTDSVGSHAKHMDTLFNRSGQSCRALYDEVTGGSPSPTRCNIDDLTRRLALEGVDDVLETNVICYSTAMSRDLTRPEHIAGAVKGDQIFRALLSHIRPAVLIAHGSGTSTRLGKCIGVKLPDPPEQAEDLRSLEVNDGDRSMAIFVVPSLALPQWNSWRRWAGQHLDMVARAVAAAL